jgi:predicted phosphodiesterase
MKNYLVPFTECTECEAAKKSNRNYWYLVSAILFFGAVAITGLVSWYSRERSIAVSDPDAFEIIDAKETAIPALPPEPIIQNQGQSAVTSSVSSENNIEKKEESFSFAIIGDTQSFEASPDSGNFQKAVNSINLANPDLVFAEGDLISDCENKKSCQTSFDNWKKVASPLISKIYAVVGNHDRSKHSFADGIWQKTFPSHPTNGPAGFQKQVYSFDFQSSHFVVLDTVKPKEEAVNLAQRKWLETDLATHGRMKNFVFFHEPAFSTREKRSDGQCLEDDLRQRDALWEIIARYHVKAVFNGHEHFFSRMQRDGVYQFIVGNTDAPQVDTPKQSLSEYNYQGNAYAILTVVGQKVNLKLYSVDGGLINYFDF